MKKAIKNESLARVIIRLNLANQDLAGAINTAAILDNRHLTTEEWHNAYKKMGSKSIAKTLTRLKNKKANLLFVDYLEKWGKINEMIESADQLSITINPKKINSVVRKLIKEELPDAEIQIMAAVDYLGPKMPELSKKWLEIVKKIALEKGNLELAFKTSAILNPSGLSEKEKEHLLIIHLNKLILEIEKNQQAPSTKNKNILAESKESLKIIEMFLPEKAIYQKLIFGENNG